ncbi:apolipoprotein N-acyltransferase [Natronospora cellulosivora (SeqCode)]
MINFKSLLSKKYLSKRYFLAVLAGFLLSAPLSYPSLFFLSWIGLIPFLFAIRELSTLKVFISGTLMGSTLIFYSSYWLYYPLIEFSGLPYIPAFFMFFLLFILYGLIYGFWAIIYKFIKNDKDISVFLLAITWIGFEYLRYLFFSELPFGYLAYTQANFLSLVQFAEYGGIFLVGFILILINGYMYKSLIRKNIRYIVPMILFLVFIVFFGAWRINQYNNEDYESIEVAVIQTSLDPQEKWLSSNIEPNIDNLMSKSHELDGVKLIVWPETALTFDLIRNQYYYDKFMEYFPLEESYLQISGHAIIDNNVERYNSSFLLTPDGSIENRYNKMRLVPFGEYFPMVDLIRKLGVRLSSQTPGNEATIFSLDSFAWRTVICSEILFPYLVQKNILEADFIVTQSVESWYRRGNLQEQMWAATIFRAVENRRSVLKSANMGYGGIISPAGTSIVKKHSQEKSLISNEIALNNIETLYQRWGDFIAIISLILLITLLVIRLIMFYLHNKK